MKRIFLTRLPGIVLVILLVAALMCTQFSWVASADGGEPTGTVALEFQNPEGNSVDPDGSVVVTTGTEVTMKPRVTVSSGVLPEGSYLKVEVPKKFLVSSYNGISAGSSSSLMGDPVYGYGDPSSVQLKFREISGTSVEIPVVLKTKNLAIPPNTKCVVKGTVYDPSGKVLAQDTITIRFQCSYAEYWKTKDHEYSGWESYLTPDEKRTVSDPSKLEVHQIDLSDMLADGQVMKTGTYYPRKFKLVFKITNSNVLYDESFGIEEVTNQSVGWTYDASSKTLTRTYDLDNGWRAAKVFLKLPNTPISEKTPIGTLQMIELDENGNEVSGEGRTNISTASVYISKTSLLHLMLAGYTHDFKYYEIMYPWLRENREKTTAWGTSLYNYVSGTSVQKGETLPDGSSSDYRVTDSVFSIKNSPHLYFTTFRICADDTTAPAARFEKNRLYGVAEDGTETLIAENIKVGQTVTIPADKAKAKNGGYRSLKITFPDRPLLQVGERICFVDETKVFEDDWDNARQTGSNWHLGDLSSYENGGKLLTTPMHQHFKGNYKWKNSSGEEKDGNKEITETLYVLSGGTLDMRLDPQDHVTSVPQGAKKIVTVDLDWDKYTTQEEEADGKVEMLVNPKCWLVLPEGWEYGGDEHTYATYARDAGTNGVIPLSYFDLKAKIIDDFQGTGRTAVYVDGFPTMYFLSSVSFAVRATENAPAGDSEFTAYLAYDNNGPYQLKAHEDSAAVDVYDLNGNGSRTDSILSKKLTLKMVPGSEFNGTAQSGLTLDKLSSSALTGLKNEDPFYLGLLVQDNEPSGEVRSFTALDVLPSVNDAKILSGSGEKRNSAYPVKLTGPVKVLKDGKLVDPESCGYIVTYSTETPAQEDVQGNLEKTFTPASSGWTAADWANVTMFRIQMKDGETIRPGEKVRFAAPAAAENGAEGAEAKNSFAYAKSSDQNANFTASSFLESNQAVVRIAKEENPPVLNPYKITKGDGSSWTRNTENGITMVSDGPFEKLTEATIDGAPLDRSRCRASDAGTDVTLPAAYLETLSTGTHTLVLKYSDGTSDGAKGTFTVNDPTYRIIRGDGSAWIKGSGDTLSMTADGPIAKFTGIEVDGAAVDASDYEATRGSTTVTLKNAYLETLEAGNHTLTVLYRDGKASGTFVVKRNAPKDPDNNQDQAEPTKKPGVRKDGKPTGKSGGPKTGDGAGTGTWTVLLAAAGTAAVILDRKRKKNKAEQDV